MAIPAAQNIKKPTKDHLKLWVRETSHDLQWDGSVWWREERIEKYAQGTTDQTPQT
jgi:hypothetical protein